VEEARIQDQLAGEVVAKQLSVRALESRIQQLGRARSGKVKRRAPQSVFIKAAAEELTQVWSARVEIKPRGKGGALTLHYANEAELDRLFEGLKKGPTGR
jgi:ParB family chromosome partitioning protein